jgi:hypothetical protein
MYTYRDKKSGPEKAIPRVILIVGIAVIQKYGPLITRHGQFSTAKLFLSSKKR